MEARASLKINAARFDKIAILRVIQCEKERGRAVSMNEQEYQRRVRECLPSLYRVARAILYDEQDCADAVQEAVFQGWLKRGQLRDVERFRAWLSRITVNACRSLQRGKLKQKRAVEAGVERLRQAPPRPSSALEAALSKLPEKYRLPIVLYYIEAYSTREIAAMLELPEGRIRDRMRAARKLLERMLNHEED